MTKVYIQECSKMPSMEFWHKQFLIIIETKTEVTPETAGLINLLSNAKDACFLFVSFVVAATVCINSDCLINVYNTLS